MLIGIWKNIEDLEESLNLEELEAIVTAARDKEHRTFKAMAAVQGIDIDENEQTDTVAKFDEIKMQVAAQLSGKSKDHLEFNELGVEFEMEE